MRTAARHANTRHDTWHVNTWHGVRGGNSRGGDGVLLGHSMHRRKKPTPWQPRFYAYFLPRAVSGRDRCKRSEEPRARGRQCVQRHLTLGNHSGFRRLRNAIWPKYGRDSDRSGSNSSYAICCIAAKWITKRTLRRDHQARSTFQGFRWWGRKDSNLRSHEAADLQSAPFATRDTPPFQGPSRVLSAAYWRTSARR